MRLSSESCRVLYEALIQMPPMKAWKMPPSDMVQFQVIRDPKCYGEYEGGPHIIRLSSVKIGHLDTAIKTMAHEMVHLKRFADKDKNWDRHDARFKELADQICKEFGFDAKEF
jgi:hypothetical protein